MQQGRPWVGAPSFGELHLEGGRYGFELGEGGGEVFEGVLPHSPEAFSLQAAIGRLERHGLTAPDPWPQSRGVTGGPPGPSAGRSWHRLK